MAFVVLLLMICVPIAEIALFIEIGGLIGVFPTLAVIVLTAVIGTALLRQQGLRTLRRAQESLEANRLPVTEVFDGMCLLFAGALLLTPGFFTDTVGFALFIPLVRSFVMQWLSAYLVRSGRVEVWVDGPGGAPQQPRGPGPGVGTVIEGEFEDVTHDGKPRNRNSGPEHP